MLKKLSFVLLSGCISTSLFAAGDLCKSLSGTWIGNGTNQSGLFPSPFPFALQLKYKRGMLYGYTQAVKGNKVSFGKTTADYLFFANCSNNMVSKIYFVKQNKSVCGDPESKTYMLTSKTSLTNFPIFYENAMTNAELHVNLTQQHPGAKMDKTLLKQVMQAASSSIKSCS